MRFAAMAILVAVLAACGAPEALAQYDRANSVQESPAAKAAIDRGDYPTALALAQAEIAACFASDRRGVTCVDLLLFGANCGRLGARFADAEALARRALRTAETAWGAASPKAGEAHLLIGELRFDRGDYAEAEQELRLAWLNFRASLGPDHWMLARSYSDYAMTLAGLGRDTDAERMAREALRINLQAFGERHSLTAQARANLAAILVDLGDMAEAELLARQALATRVDIFGADHAQAALAMYQLGKILVARRRYRDADALLRQALDRSIATMGARHPHTAVILSDLGYLANRMGKPDEAATFYRRSLDTYVALFGEHHPSSAQALMNLAVATDAAGDSAAAETMSRRSVELYRERFEAGSPALATSLNNLGAILERRGAYAEAADLYQTAVGNLSAAGLDQVGRNAIATDNLALVEMRHLGRADLALARLRRLAASAAPQGVASSAREFDNDTSGRPHPVFAHLVEGAWRVAHVDGQDAGEGDKDHE